MLSLATKFVPEPAFFQMASDSGFRAAEFWLDSKVIEQSDQIVETASRFPFRYALHFPNRGPISPDHLVALVSLYQKLNSTALVIHQPMFDHFGAMLKQLNPNLDLAVENHVLDLAGFERWADLNPGLTLDVEHLWKFTLPDASLSILLQQVDKFLERYAGKLQHVHLLGYHPGEGEHRPVHHNSELTTEILTRLVSHGFEKLVVSEADLPYQNHESLSKDVQLFEQWKKTIAR